MYRKPSKSFKIVKNTWKNYQKQPKIVKITSKTSIPSKNAWKENSQKNTKTFINSLKQHQEPPKTNVETSKMRLKTLKAVKITFKTIKNHKKMPQKNQKPSKTIKKPMKTIKIDLKSSQTVKKLTKIRQKLAEKSQNTSKTG